jgi:pimeloyl-ACP methyl ester carboxylesterase
MPTAASFDATTIAYETAGDGPPLVLVHGITECRWSWDPLIAPLARDHRVVAIDLRGHGESERRAPYDVATLAADVRAVVDAAGLTDPVVVGHSLGGAVVSLYAASNPVRGVVNVDQPIELGGFKDLLTPLEPLLRSDEPTFQSIIQQIFASLYGALAADERARLASISRPEQQVVLGVWDLVFHSTKAELDVLIRNAARAISAPYLSLHGSDPGDGYAAWLHSALPTATLEVWPELGHYPHLVEPDRFLRRLSAFESEL